MRALRSIVTTAIMMPTCREEHTVNTLEAATSVVHAKARIRWGRILTGGILSEVGVVVVLLAIIATYSYVIAPGLSNADYERFGELAGYYVAPAAGAVITFLVVLWVARPLTSGFIAHGLLVGLVSVLLTIAFFFMAKPEHRAMYLIAFALRLAAGYAGGRVAQRRGE